VRDLLFYELEAAHYPIREIEILSDSEEMVELAATLVPTNAKSDELDAVVVALEKSGRIRTATWTLSKTA
jgi:putative Mg2+ transporter-C (MgtC) family protein